MMRRRAAVGLLAGVLLAGLVAAPGTPAGAQDIADLPRLGYEITPDRGHVGDEVHSQVNPADVEEHCWNSLYADVGAVVEQAIEDGEDMFEFMLTEEDLEEFLTSFSTEFAGYWTPGTWLQQHRDFPLPPWPLFDQVIDAFVAMYGDWPSGEDPARDMIAEVRNGPVPEGIPVEGVPGVITGEQFLDHVGSALNTGLNVFFGQGELIPALYQGVHVTTFVDPVTQEMVGATGLFDPETGEGVMPVPDLDPGLYAVAAACAWFPPYDELPQALEDGFVAAWDWSLACHEANGEGFDVLDPTDCFPTGVPSAFWRDWAEAGGFAAVFGAIAEPRAIGIDFYCILQDDGLCATPPGPVGLIDDGVLDEFNGDGPGDELPGPGTEGLEGTGDLVAVQAAPSFTG